MKEKIGFTGTQKGMNKHQKETLEHLLYLLRNSSIEFHHGDCVGADYAAHAILWNTIDCVFVVHPPEISDKRAFAHTTYPKPSTILRNPKPYLKRNRDIVDETDLLIAAPQYTCEERRSGTWATIRYARKQGKPVIILDPGHNGKGVE